MMVMVLLLSVVADSQQVLGVYYIWGTGLNIFLLFKLVTQRAKSRETQTSLRQGTPPSPTGAVGLPQVPQHHGT